MKFICQATNIKLLACFQYVILNAVMWYENEHLRHEGARELKRIHHHVTPLHKERLDLRILSIVSPTLLHSSNRHYANNPNHRPCA